MNAEVQSNSQVSFLKKNWYVFVLVFVVFLLLGIIGALLMQNDKDKPEEVGEEVEVVVEEDVEDENDQERIANDSNAQALVWSFNGETWSPPFGSTIPACDSPLTINEPADLSKATMVLYPGQVRGGDYKPHGGFGFPSNSNAVEVALPMDAVLWRGSRYIEGGEVQYILDFVTPCGILFRFDHLLTLSETFDAIVQELPEPQVDESRTSQFTNPKMFQVGEVIATEIGHRYNNNVGFDFGMYDLRQQNEVSQDPAYASAHADEKETAFYAVCALDYFTKETADMLRAVPQSNVEGSKSDYCKL